MILEIKEKGLVVRLSLNTQVYKLDVDYEELTVVEKFPISYTKGEIIYELIKALDKLIAHKRKENVDLLDNALKIKHTFSKLIYKIDYATPQSA